MPRQDNPSSAGRPGSAPRKAGPARSGRPAGTNQGRPAASPGGRPAAAGDKRADGPREDRSGRTGAKPAAGPREDRSGRARRTAGPAAKLTDAQKAEIAARYDPRREKRRQEARVPLPDDVEPQMLDKEVRTELRSLAKDTADLVARHLVMTGRLLDEEPDQALRHARAARALAGRVAAVREAAGLAAYLNGEWTEGLSELRAARRISGRADHLAVMADCERALGRPEKALAYADDDAVPTLDQALRVELVIVLAGARRDLGQPDAAVVLLQDPARRTTHKRLWAARLWYAYADALLAAGRSEEARDWFGRIAEVDADGETDAVDRLLELDGVVLEDPDDDGQYDEDDADPGVDRADG
jgi:tetratricopeptide (TPR) repeat protein